MNYVYVYIYILMDDLELDRILKAREKNRLSC